MEAILTATINIILVSFFGVMTIDFVIGLCLTMQAATVTKQSITEQLKSQSPLLELLPDPWFLEELPEIAVVPVSESDEATIQYLEMTGCDINDFESIAEARKFLDENAPWTIETLPTQPVETQAILPDSWDVNVAEVKAVEKDTREQSPKAEEKLTFESVCAAFARQGLTFQKHRSSRYRYKVVNSHSSPCQFKKLQDALDWLATSKPLMPTV